MSDSFDLDAPDHFTVGAVGPPGQRVFYLQARQARQLLTLKCEKEQVRALGEYLGGLLAKLPGGAGEDAGDTALLEPVDAAWTVAALGVGYDQDGDRVVLETRELLEEEAEEEPATARFHLTRGQAGITRETLHALVKALDIPDAEKRRLLALTPATYIGKATELAQRTRSRS
jgi:uncharacterized repeat protein (TIGR03847 family)